MQTHTIEVILQEDGRLALTDLPFRAGDRVEVVVRETSKPADHVECDRYPLRGTVVRYDRPFDPAVPEEDWEVLQ